MKPEKTNWKWGEEAKNKLNSLSESSVRANALAANQLGNQAYKMLHSKKAKYETNPLFTQDPYQSLGDTISVILGNLFYSQYPENKSAKILKDNADTKIRQAKIRATEEITAANEIINLISFMKPNEIYNLIKDLGDNTPFTEIASKLNSLHPQMP